MFIQRLGFYHDLTKITTKLMKFPGKAGAIILRGVLLLNYQFMKTDQMNLISIINVFIRKILCS
jgi:hypothetical protein